MNENGTTGDTGTAGGTPHPERDSLDQLEAFLAEWAAASQGQENGSAASRADLLGELGDTLEALLDELIKAAGESGESFGKNNDFNEN
jgi:hypothetical protein